MTPTWPSSSYCSTGHAELGWISSSAGYVEAGTTLIRGGALFVVGKMVQIWFIASIILAVKSVKWITVSVRAVGL